MNYSLMVRNYLIKAIIADKGIIDKIIDKVIKKLIKRKKMLD